VGKYWRAKQATEGNMVHAHCMLDTEGKNRDIYSEYVIIIVLPLLQWLRERASMFLNNYEIVYLVLLVFHLNVLSVAKIVALMVKE
jgi:hypothetical protein